MLRLTVADSNAELLDTAKQRPSRMVTMKVRTRATPPTEHATRECMLKQGRCMEYIVQYEKPGMKREWQRVLDV